MNKIGEFLSNLWREQQIPLRDKKIHVLLLVLIISPLDAIPDWISWVGLLDDAFYFAIIGDFYFNILDSRILLSHFPSDMKSFSRLKKIFTCLDFLIPNAMMNSFWHYKRDIY